jgi:hypothetical protein
MRILLAVAVAVAVAVAAVELLVKGWGAYRAVSIPVVDKCGSNKTDAVREFAVWTVEKYRNLTGDYPSLCSDFRIELTKLPSGYAGFAYFRYEGGSVCVYLIQIDCTLSDFETRMALVHEFGHAMQARYMRGDLSGMWVLEALPEGATVLIMGELLGVPWYGFQFSRAYYTEQLYRKNPWECRAGGGTLCEYKYSGAVAWILLRYGFGEVYKQFSMPNTTYINEKYVAFLLSPWQWPYRPEFTFLVNCRDGGPAYSGLYCYDDREYLNEGDVIISANAAYGNATFEGGRLLMAFAHTSSLPLLDVSITVRRCNATETKTETVTKTVTETVTATKTVTETATKTVTATQTVTQTETATKTTTETVTATKTATVTKTETVTVPVTVTQVVTVPITETVTKIVTETRVVNNTVTTTVPVTYTMTQVVTTTYVYTTAIPTTVTETRTVTETVYEGGFDVNAVVVIAVVALVFGCLACGLARS